MDPRTRSLRILSLTQAILNLIVAGAMVVTVHSQSGGSQSLSILAVGLSLVGFLYYFTLHQFFKNRHLVISTAFMGIITAVNLGLIVTGTGGFDSPYYSFWLLAIASSGVFGMNVTLGTLWITAIFYLIQWAANQWSGTFLAGHISQILVTVAAAALAEWVHGGVRRSSSQAAAVQSLSGQLSEEQLKAQVLMASMGEGVMVVDTQRQVRLFNRAAQNLTGWDEVSAQNINYLSILNLKTTDDQPVTDANDPFSEAWNKGETIIRDNVVMITKGGHKKVLSMTVSPIVDDNNIITGGIALFRDVSQEKALERQRDEFISTASHEMRTPVAAIEGYISLSMNANVATIDERAKGYLEKAHDATTHLGALFRDLLSITKIEKDANTGGKMEIIEVGKMLEAVVSDMQFTAAKKKLTLIYQPSSTISTSKKVVAPLYYVKADPARLREVTTNLVDNAIKYTKEGGITVAISGTKDSVTVNVIDTGPGIAAEDIPHLFQKFYRVDNSATRTVGGTGLGLYLCRTVIELYGGRVWVNSQLGRGSSFNFSLPRIATEEAEVQLSAKEGGAAAVAAPTVPAVGLSSLMPVSAAAQTQSAAPASPTEPVTVPSAPAAPEPTVAAAAQPSPAATPTKPTLT